VPQAGVASTNNLDAIADRLMFRLAYRNFGSFESVVGNYTVSSGGVAGVRWFELRNVTSGPETVFQESTYQPDSTWRWMGSVAMDHYGDLALGFSASSSAINPQIRYAGRLVTDPLNQLAQGEAHLFDGTGSQTGSGNRWGDYSDLTIDPVDDCTFWYTTEYYATTSAFNWRTRIGSFKFPSCGNADMAVAINAAPSPATLNRPLTYTVAITNGGPAGATGVVVTTTLPAGSVVGPATPSQGSCTLNGLVPVCTLGSMGNGASASIRVVITPTIGGTLTATTRVAAVQLDPNLSNNSATANTPVTPPTAVTLERFSVSESDERYGLEILALLAGGLALCAGLMLSARSRRR